MEKKVTLAVFLVLLMVSSVWAADSVTISMSCTIPAVPGVNAPALIPEITMLNYLREDVINKNSAATVGEEIIEKEESKEILLAQGEKVTAELKTIYAR